MSDHRLPPQDHVVRSLSFFHRRGDCFEVRAIGSRNAKKIVDGGFFDDQGLAAAAVAALVEGKRHDGIYVTLNPLNSALLGRASNRLVPGLAGAQDKDVLLLRRLLVDVDPERPSGVSASEAEHGMAIEWAKEISRTLAREGWPVPLVADSSNGSHVLYGLPDLENTAENVELLRSVLRGLANRFNVMDKGVTLQIDEKVFNPARISKVYGTIGRKGENTKARPHRWARIISMPDVVIPVPVELLRKMAATAEPTGKGVRGAGPSDQGGRFDLPGFLEHYGVAVRLVKVHHGCTLYVLERCLFDESHGSGEAAIGQTPEGKLIYQCFHDSCKGYTWRDARQKISGTESLARFMIGRQVSASAGGRAQSQCPANNGAGGVGVVEATFPRIDFPWDALPPRIEHSLKLLARACASSPLSLPGAAIGILASIIGRLAGVSPKEGWVEPLIFWFMHVAPSGSGKSPGPGELIRPLHRLQELEHLRWAQEMAEYRKLSPREQRATTPPAKPRGYFCTDLTLEGLRTDLAEHPTGGTMVLLDEMSAFVSAQNQYKAKGNDRESWLTLWAGQAARVVRAETSYYLTGSRPNVYGGTQPVVFKRAFGTDEGGLYLHDGTLFRVLITAQGTQFFELSAEAWGETDRKPWEDIINRAVRWTEGLVKTEQSHRMILDSEAQERFFTWRNNLEGTMPDLPGLLRGFLPKAYGYALRLAGVIHLMRRFDAGQDPDTILTSEDMERGIAAAEFYLGQTSAALQMLEDPTHTPLDVDPRVDILAGVLQELKADIDDGRLAVGYIHDKLNEKLPPELRFRSRHAKSVAAFLRSLGLTVKKEKHNANGRRAVFCLSWNKKTDSFVETRLHYLQCLQTHTQQGFAGADDESFMSALSAPDRLSDAPLQTMQTSEIACLHPETLDGQQFADNADKADNFPKEEEIFI